jgi:hypothetical protein
LPAGSVISIFGKYSREGAAAELQLHPRGYLFLPFSRGEE